jgi:hypothetical protein
MKLLILTTGIAAVVLAAPVQVYPNKGVSANMPFDAPIANPSGDKIAIYYGVSTYYFICEIGPLKSIRGMTMRSDRIVLRRGNQ